MHGEGVAPARHPDAAVQLLLDRVAIRDLVVRYATGVDRRDFELVESCFSPDVSGEFGGEERADRDALLAFIRGVSHFHTTMHFMGNHFIGIEGDAASSDTLAMITHRATGRDGRVFELDVSDARYHERVERRDDAWTITRRGEPPRWAESGATRVASADPAVTWLLDRVAIEDLLYREALGADLREYDRVTSCFAPDFRVRHAHGARDGGDLELTDAVALREHMGDAERFAATTHMLGMPRIEVPVAASGDSSRATAWCAVLVTMREALPAGAADEAALPAWRRRRPPERTAIRWYTDRLERHDGRWRITDRLVADRPPASRAEGFPPRSGDPIVQWLIDRAAIRDRVAEALPAPEDGGTTAHLLGNHSVDVGDDNARAETYAYVIRTDVGGRGVVSHWAEGARRYVDELERADDGWSLARRRIRSNRVRESNGRIEP